MIVYVHNVALRAWANQWPLSFQGGIRQSGSSTGPHPTSHQSYRLITSSTMTTIALFIAGLLNYICVIYVWYLCCCELQTCFVVYLTWRHVKSIFVCFRLQIPFVYFGISADDVLLDFQNRWLRWECTRTLCTVFSALNKICCILLWTLYILLFAVLSITFIKHQNIWRALLTNTHFYFLINTYAPFL